MSNKICEVAIDNLISSFEKLSLCDAETVSQSFAAFEENWEFENDINILSDDEQTCVNNGKRNVEMTENDEPTRETKVRLVEMKTNRKRKAMLSARAEGEPLPKIRKTKKITKSQLNTLQDIEDANKQEKSHKLEISVNGPLTLECEEVKDEESIFGDSSVMDDIECVDTDAPKTVIDDSCENEPFDIRKYLNFRKTSLKSNEMTAQGVKRSLDDTDAVTDPVKCGKKYETKKERSATPVVEVPEEATEKRNDILKNYYAAKINHLKHIETLKERAVIAAENISTRFSQIADALCKFMAESDETD